MNFKKWVLIPLFLFVSVSSNAATVWINEFHYDNQGTDQGEFVEIAGLSTTDLTGWSLNFYNGANSSLYRELSLTGFNIDDEQSGYGALAFDLPVNGIQNGSPDGIALVDDLGSFVQFLSYEGVFTVNGMLSEDIGVSELSTTLIGDSLQLMGTGSSYSDFTWTGPSLNSKGSLNEGQFISAVPEPATLSLMLGGIAMLGFMARRRCA